MPSDKLEGSNAQADTSGRCLSSHDSTNDSTSGSVRYDRDHSV